MHYEQVNYGESDRRQDRDGNTGTSHAMSGGQWNGGSYYQPNSKGGHKKKCIFFLIVIITLSATALYFFGNPLENKSIESPQQEPTKVNSVPTVSRIDDEIPYTNSQTEPKVNNQAEKNTVHQEKEQPKTVSPQKKENNQQPQNTELSLTHDTEEVSNTLGKKAEDIQTPSNERTDSEGSVQQNKEFEESSVNNSPEKINDFEPKQEVEQPVKQRKEENKQKIDEPTSVSSEQTEKNNPEEEQAITNTQQIEQKSGIPNPWGSNIQQDKIEQPSQKQSTTLEEQPSTQQNIQKELIEQNLQSGKVQGQQNEETPTNPKQADIPKQQGQDQLIQQEEEPTVPIHEEPLPAPEKQQALEQSVTVSTKAQPQLLEDPTEQINEQSTTKTEVKGSTNSLLQKITEEIAEIEKEVEVQVKVIPEQVKQQTEKIIQQIELEQQKIVQKVEDKKTTKSGSSTKPVKGVKFQTQTNNVDASPSQEQAISEISNLTQQPEQKVVQQSQETTTPQNEGKEKNVEQESGDGEQINPWPEADQPAIDPAFPQQPPPAIDSPELQQKPQISQPIPNASQASNVPKPSSNEINQP